MRFLAVTFGWIPAVLLLAPVWLDATAHEGYRPDLSELITAVSVGAAVSGLIAGVVLARGGVRGLMSVVAAVGAAAVVCLVANDAVYRFVIPLPDDLRGGGWGVTDVVWAPLAAAVGFGLGLLLRHALGSRRVIPRRRGWVVAAVVGLVGVFAVPAFVRVGAELAVTRFVPADAVPVAGGGQVTVAVDAGRHAIFGYHGSEPCALGDGIALARPAVPLSDNSDSVVTVLLGTFEVAAPTAVTVTCGGQAGDQFSVGDPPALRGPLGALVFGAPAVPLGVGLAPGLLIAAVTWARRRRRSPRAVSR